MTEAAKKKSRTAGKRVGRYDLVARLAVGGMGELFLAREQGIAGFERLVVIKRIRPHMAASVAFRDMFLREARILARIAHPNVVQTVELGKDGANYYLVLEYLQGSTLRELQVLAEDADVAIPPGVVVGAITQGLRGLHAAHELRDLQGNLLGTVHRDLSPHNLMCSPEGHVKLFDFGVAKGTEVAEVTHSGFLKGKLAYMSPEQCRHKEIDRRSDLFSAGVVLWEMFAGQRLFKREAEMDTLNAITNGEVPSLQEIRPELPAEVCEVVHRALEVDPEERWPTASALETALLEAARDAGWDTSVNAVAEFVELVAADRLDSRAKTLSAALERALTFQERLALIHSTGRQAEDDELVAEDVDETIIVQPVSLSGTETETQVSMATTVIGTKDELAAKARWPIAAVVIGLLATVVGLGAWFAMQPKIDGPEIVLVWAPVQEEDVLRQEVRPILEYLERELERPIRLVVPKDYQEAADQLIDGRAEFAVLPPYIYVLTKQREPAIRPLANQLFDGSRSADGLLLVKAEGPVRTVGQLEGQTFCMPDENSTTGTLLPRAYLRSQGHDPAEFIGKVHWSGSHQQVLRDVLDGTCVAGATYSGNLLTADSYGIASGQFRRLALTGTSPNEAVVAGPKTDSGLAGRLQRALLDLEPKRDTDVESIGESQRITGYSEVDEEAFEFIRQGLDE